MSRLDIHLLGEFRLLYDQQLVTRVNTPRLQSLLTYLLLHCQAPQPRQQIAFQFWPASSEQQAHTNLRKLLFQLRNALPDADQFLQQDRLTVQWNPAAPFTLDVAELRRLLSRGPAHGAATAEGADQANLVRIVQLYQGELLPSCHDDWLLLVRQQLHRDVIQAVEQLVNLAEHQREYRMGIRYAQRLLGLDPLHEAGYRRLMQLHALNGDRAAALHEYHTCATLLQRELGVEPDEETRTLYEHLLHQAGHALAPIPAIPATAPLIGRQTEWALLLAAWRRGQRGQAHFVAIAGEAGIGKSRLIEELMVWVRAQGGGMAQTRSYEAEGGLAYAPVVEWLRSPRLQPLIARLDRPWLSEVARLLPELLTTQPALAAPAPITQAWERQRLFEALARLVLLDKGPLARVHWPW
jgi:DNA-binding SARP family transcriptional activator